jgi:hypothetical protein
LTEEEANTDGNMMEDMPLEGKMPIDPAAAEEDLVQQITEETGAEGDPHQHNERKSDEISQDITEETGGHGDMNLHAERKVDDMGNRLHEE